MLQTTVVEKIRPHFLCSVIFPPEIVPFMRLCGKIWYSQTGHRFQNNMARARCVLDH
jgi:hypothetical protein